MVSILTKKPIILMTIENLKTHYSFKFTLQSSHEKNFNKSYKLQPKCINFKKYSH